jgi:hypothetical protein
LDGLFLCKTFHSSLHSNKCKSPQQLQKSVQTEQNNQKLCHIRFLVFDKKQIQKIQLFFSSFQPVEGISTTGITSQAIHTLSAIVRFEQTARIELWLAAARDASERARGSISSLPRHNMRCRALGETTANTATITEETLSILPATPSGRITTLIKPDRVTQSMFRISNNPTPLFVCKDL